MLKEFHSKIFWGFYSKSTVAKVRKLSQKFYKIFFTSQNLDQTTYE